MPTHGASGDSGGGSVEISYVVTRTANQSGLVTLTWKVVSESRVLPLCQF